MTVSFVRTVHAGGTRRLVTLSLCNGFVPSLPLEHFTGQQILRQLFIWGKNGYVWLQGVLRRVFGKQVGVSNGMIAKLHSERHYSLYE